MIVGGWLYWETGLGGTDGELADLGVVYEAGDGTDDVDALLDGIDVYDGATAPAPLAALPTGSIMLIGTDVGAFPYKVTGGWGTVRLTSVTGDFVTAKDVKLLLYVIYPA
jgi:hypothetical protein